MTVLVRWRGGLRGVFPAGVSEPYVFESSGYSSSAGRDSVSGGEIERRLVLGALGLGTGEGGLPDCILQCTKQGLVGYNAVLYSL